ncbi:HipA N-terminal domain-containing protein [Micromonospora sp. CPCC 205371]|nr:HipA N-terminal domain-containing protein [Micromonospora sp. CPCC 205371]
MAGRRVGVIAEGGDGRLSLEYDEQWRVARDATPLSLSMPLVRRTHPDAVVRPFLWGVTARQRTGARAVGADLPGVGGKPVCIAAARR